MDRDSEPPFENGPESPCSGDDTKICSAPSPKKSRRGVQKRVVSVPIGELEGSKSKGEAYPPSDSWAWRKYGQKPIKGSPYPRGYYRCSSSKGCPARKQVERSRVDPNMLVITYSCDHNHPAPTTRHHSSASAAASSSPFATSATTDSPAKLHPEEVVDFANDHDLALGVDSSPLLDERFLWFADVASTNVLESPICEGISSCSDGDVAMVFSMGEDEESLFADLGELPECSVVFRRSFVKPDEPNRRCNLTAISCYDSAS